MIIDHIGFAVSDAAASNAFFSQALAPLGIVAIAEHDGWTGYGRDGKPELWFGQGEPAQGSMHLCLLAHSRADVRAFHAAALAAGGRDNGAPGLREHYHPNYYGAFVIGPDGHNVEAVCHAPEV